jgi:hypothetical protein
MQITLQSRIKLQTGNNWKLTQRVERINKEIMQKETWLQDNRKLSMTEGTTMSWKVYFASSSLHTEWLQTHCVVATYIINTDKVLIIQ